MDPAFVKEIVHMLCQSVDAVVAATPGIWDNIVWGGARKTILSDAVINALIDRLLKAGMIQPEQVAAVRASFQAA